MSGDTVDFLTHSTIRPFVNASGLLGSDSLCALSPCQVLKCGTLTPVIKTPYVRLGIEYESILGGPNDQQQSMPVNVSAGRSLCYRRPIDWWTMELSNLRTFCLTRMPSMIAQILWWVLMDSNHRVLLGI